MFSFVKKEKESSRESCERAKRQLRGGLERAERESWDTERGTKERALRERELKRVQKRAQGRGSHIHSLLSSYVLCPPKGEAAVRLLWFSYIYIGVCNQGSPFVLFKKDCSKDSAGILFLRKWIYNRRGVWYLFRKGQKDYPDYQLQYI